MKKTKKRGTPEKLVCDFCGAVKEEITFIIGACSKPGSDWCMIYGTGKMACPACYARAMEEAQNKGRAIEESQAAPKATPAAAAALSVALVNNGLSLSQAPAAPVEPAACQDCTRKRGKAGPCSDYGGFGCGLYFEQHPETHFKEEPEKVQEVEAEILPAAPIKAPAMTFKTCCVCGAGTKGAQHWNRDTGYGVCPVCVVSMKCKGTSDAEIKDLYGVEGVNYPSLAEADAALAKPAPTQEEPAPGSFESKDAAEALRPILDRVIKSVYLPDYRAKVTYAEALGVLIAKFFKWDGGEILAAAYAALEDANYHADIRIIERMQKGEDVEALIQDMAKELSAMHSEYLKDCAGGCPTLELIKRATGKAPEAVEHKHPAPAVKPDAELLAALIWQRDYCDKQALENTEEAALWRQAAGKARAAIERLDK